MGDNLSLRCDINRTKGITSSMSIVWKINNTKIGGGIGSSISNKISISVQNTTSFLNISSLELTDSNTVYCCQVVINTSQSVNASNHFTLYVNGSENAIPAANPAATPPADSQPTSLIAIIISAIIVFIIIGFITALFAVNHCELKRYVW